MQARQSLQRGFAGPPGTAVRRQAASRRPRVAAPAAEGPGTGEGDPCRKKAGTSGHSAPPAIPYSFTYTCRHRNPPDPENRQAVPGINLRVNSQTYIRAQLVKQ